MPKKSAKRKTSAKDIPHKKGTATPGGANPPKPDPKPKSRKK